uniref:Kinesin light chain n=1 Tax=Eucampia antarctica TaxID=49252 RepID=A0A7S2S3T6_9STRA|mmetsp:Transcript_30589/g.29500  ORF Transcript_30589/g.29500 Transcript_30589/m.29500 type:complete len:334 (+) Transcript_30589:65-1066(+)|eukprot:CAMPEP_0197835144 /NCGR_PEP_ID=MMETSP1437-20131217/24863_1 /TAXON_ID=49252 ORGANISM="Eucampia antarctica, Strain CCMP1452" /NCGR_SAMPLE_ID=MMETSP1437 /ASSEMBLY_ACC=CAM_ASM_001096 /LENGTH=333 /DNA_ID=CAMNT_0043440355 /DNA_START=60 /DNA_END=1061 /DNA_ORIENTATION=+
MWFLKKNKKSQSIPDLLTCSMQSASSDCEKEEIPSISLETEAKHDNNKEEISLSSDPPEKPFFLMEWAKDIEPEELKRVQNALSLNQQLQENSAEDNNIVAQSESLIHPKCLRRDSFIKQPSLKHLFETRDSLSEEQILELSEDNALEKGRSLNQQGLKMATGGDYLHAIGIWIQAIQILVTFYGEFHSDVALIMNNMGIAYGKMNLYEEAKEMLQESLFVRKELYGQHHVSVAASLHSIGNLLLSFGDMKESLDAHLEAIAIRTRVLGPNHKEVAFSHNGIGHAYYDMKKYNEAYDEFAEALRISSIAGLPLDHHVIEDSRNGLEMLEELIS